MRRECGLDQCICLLLHLIWTHMQVGVREGGTKPSIITSKKKKKEKKKNNTAFIWILSKHYVSTFFLFSCVSCLYSSFHILLMPQWIKIQSLLEINNTQNIQRILECFTVRVLKTSSDSTWTNVPTAAASQMTRGGMRPHSNHKHKCLLVSWISTLILSHPALTSRQDEELSECIRTHPRVTCVACYDAVSLHTSRGCIKGRVSIQYCLWLQLERYVQRRRDSF